MIQPTSSYSGYYRTDAVNTSNGNKAPAPKPQSDAGDRLSSSGAAALREALGSTPEVRSQVVQRGKALAVDPTYPPRAIIDDLAKLFVQTNELSDNS